MQENEMNQFMKKQEQIRVLTMNTLRDLGSEYQIKTRYLQSQLESDLLHCKSEEDSRTILKKCEQDIKTCTTEHSQKVNDVLKNYIENLKTLSLQFFN